MNRSKTEERNAWNTKWAAVGNLNTGDNEPKKTKSSVHVILHLFRARVQRPVAIHDLQKVLALLLVTRDGAAECADEGDAPLRKVAHHP